MQPFQLHMDIKNSYLTIRGGVEYISKSIIYRYNPCLFASEETGIFVCLPDQNNIF